MKKGFKHCYALIPVEFEDKHWTTKIDWTVNYFSTPLMLASVGDMMQADEQINKAYKVFVAKEVSMRYIVDIRSCVTIMKSIINVRWFFVQTPWALCKKLKKQKNAIRVR